METKIGKYKGIEVTITPVTFTEEDVDTELKNLAKSRPVTVSEEGPVQEGHAVVMDFEGIKDGVAFEGGTAKNYKLTIGSHQFIPGFEEQMVGMMKGESRELNVTFPEAYGEPSLAGQPVIFKVTVHEILSSKEGELNDEYAKSLNFEGVSDMVTLRAYVKARMNEVAERKTREKVEDAVMDELLRVTECDIPQDRADLLLQENVTRLSRELQQYQMSLEQYLQMTNQTRDSLKAQMEMSAREQAKFEQALKKIIELEGISVSDEEIDAQIKEIAEYNHVSEEEVKNRINRSAMVHDIANMKASQLVLNSTVVHKTN